MKYSNATLTNAGIELLRDLSLHEGTLRVAHVKLGNGSYSESDDLRIKTTLKSQIQEVNVSQVERDTRDQIRITATVTNEGLQTGYHMTEMGVTALDEDDTEVLLALAVVYDESEADYIPAEEQGFITSFTLMSYIKVTNNIDVTLVSETAYASLADYLVTKQKVDGISVSDDGAGNVTVTLPI